MDRTGKKGLVGRGLTLVSVALGLLLLPALAAGAGGGLSAIELADSIEGPHGFPLPKDAVEGGEVPGGGGKVRVYEVPRGRTVAAAEQRKLLAAAGWKITSDEVSPKGTVRLTTEKKGVVIGASIAGTDAKASIILTLP